MTNSYQDRELDELEQAVNNSLNDAQASCNSRGMVKTNTIQTSCTVKTDYYARYYWSSNSCKTRMIAVNTTTANTCDTSGTWVYKGINYGSSTKYGCSGGGGYSGSWRTSRGLGSKRSIKWCSCM